MDSNSSLLESGQVHSYTMFVKSNTTYHLQLTDVSGDGTCCDYGFGWFTIAGSVPDAGSNGTVVWSARGDALKSNLDVTIRVDSVGTTHLVGQSSD